MNDVAIAEQAIAALNDRLNTARARAETLATERQRLAYRVHGGADKAALPLLDACNAEMTALAVAVDDIKAAVIEAHKHLAAAQAAVARDAATEHRAKARGIIKTLVEECAPALDATREHPDGAGPYHFSDPPTVNRAGVLIVSLLTELRALKLDNGATAGDFLPQVDGETATKEDARKELVRMLQVGWRFVPPAERRPVTPGRRQPHPLPFGKMLGYWSQRLEGVLREEQTNEKGDRSVINIFKRKPRLLTKLKIAEVSAVDHAACPGAKIMLRKRDRDTGNRRGNQVPRHVG